MFGLQQLINDVAEVLYVRAGRNGEWDIIYNISENREKHVF